MRVIPFEERYRQDFIDMNRAWISEMFHKVEEQDEREFENIDAYLNRGGQIFVAVDDDDSAMAVAMIAPREDGEWELMKLAARGMYTGKGAGSACLKACIDYAREKNVQRILIVSNKKCTHAIHLYRKFGFEEIPVDKELFPFERADIAFKMEMDDESEPEKA
ncbi:MAG: GNAT family N-acetyltransferase [Coriobacteriales bacterium]|jgi:ribosomal protein S18 acetylase RimI-like enzyme